MVQSTIVYIGLMSIMMAFAKYSSQKAILNPYGSNKILHFEMLFPILLFAIIFGLRYNVGADHLRYLDNYNLGESQGNEYIFRFLTLLLSKNNFHFTIYFSLCAFIQIFFIYFTFKNEKTIILYIIFILFAGRYFIDWMNIIRQSIAFCIFVYSTIFIKEKKIFSYLFFIMIAVGFHKSAIILVPLYPLLVNEKDYFKNTYFQLMLLCIAIIFSGYEKWSPLIISLSGILEFFEYGSYIYLFQVLTRELNTGIGFALSIVVDIIIILYSNQLKNYFPNNRFKLFYNLYFVGRIMQLLFLGSMVLERPVLYFSSMKLFVVSYLLHYLWSTLRINFKLISLYLIISCYLILFSAIIIKGAETNAQFIFFWQY